MQWVSCVSECPDVILSRMAREDLADSCSQSFPSHRGTICSFMPTASAFLPILWIATEHSSVVTWPQPSLSHKPRHPLPCIQPPENQTESCHPLLPLKLPDSSSAQPHHQETRHLCDMSTSTAHLPCLDRLLSPLFCFCSLNALLPVGTWPSFTVHSKWCPSREFDLLVSPPKVFPVYLVGVTWPLKPALC